MTQRIKGFVVTLERDIREDDVQPILDAIRMVRHVASVEPVETTLEDHMARQRVRFELAEKLAHLHRDILTGG